MMMNRAAIAREALDKSLEIRDRVGLDFGTALNIFDLCDALTPKVRVLFTDFSMEGCYLKGKRPLIKLSALRPLGRRVFNCAHELGHHAFGHGSRIDELQIDGFARDENDSEEFLVNAFAGFLLMPKVAVRRAFTSRGWKVMDATANQIFTVACHFGVGYDTMVSHLTYGLQEIELDRGKDLRKIRLPAIRRSLVESNEADRLIVVDKNYVLPIVDAEVGTHLLLPPDATCERPDVVNLIRACRAEQLFLARRPGLARVEAAGDWAVIVRVAKHQYAGWSQYRHLEQEEHDDE